MFGGLELKGSSAKPAANGDEKKEVAAAPAPTASSAFSFLTGAPAPAASNDAPSSAFGFMSAGGSDKPATEPVPEKKESSSASSAFSFLTQPADDTGKKEPSPEKPASSSSFSFLSTTSAAPAPIEASKPAAASTGTGFSFMSSESPSSNEKATSSVSSEPPAETEPKAPSPAKASDFLSTANPHQPVGSGLVFGGAMPAASKKPINRRRRTQKIGSGANTATNMIGGSSASIPPPSAVQPPPAAKPCSTPQKSLSPEAPVGGFVPPSIETVSRESSAAPSSHGSTADAALEASRRAEEFMQEKMKSSAQFSAPPTPPSYSRSDPTSPQDDDYAEAKAAAMEAKAKMATPAPAGGGFRMGGLFKKKGWGRDGGASERNSSWNSSSSSIKHIPEPSTLQKEYDYGQSTVEETPAERIQREQEEITRAVAERTLAMKQQQEEEPPKKETPIVQPPPRPPTPPPPKKKTPLEILEDMIQEFSQNSSRSMDRVAHLRQQRHSLLDERAAAEKKLLLATQQISQAEAQQTVAVEEEEFDLADRLGAVMDKWESEKRELTRILENIERAQTQLNEQRNGVVGGVAACFRQVQTKLKNFQEEQENSEREDDTKAMQRFASISKQLSTENDRLMNDLKHIERDEALVAEERSEMDSAIGEHTAAVDKQRVDACQKLQTVQDEIEELRERLAAREAVANQLKAEVNEHDAAIAKVKLTFSRQIMRVQRKEATVKENRIEWNVEKAKYESEKKAHEDEVKAHSEALMSHDELMERLKSEIDLADTLEKIVTKEVRFESAAEEAGDESKEDGADELVRLQTKVVEGEAAVGEAIHLVKAAESILESLDKEHKSLIAKIPFLETQKKSAAARRDFKAAAKANKEIKDATARLKDCEEELTGEAVARVEAAKEELEQLQLDLETKKSVTLEKEKEEGVYAMNKLAERIRGLISTKKQVCGKGSENSVQAVGAVVLNGQIKALQKEGEAYGAKFGGWEDLMNEIYGEQDDDSKPAKVPEESKKFDLEPAVLKEDEEDEKGERDEGRGQTQPRKAKVAKFKELTERLKDAEESLEAAVEREDYDEAAELDIVFQQIQAEVEELGLTDAEMDEAFKEAETNGDGDDRNAETAKEEEEEDTIEAIVGDNGERQTPELDNDDYGVKQPEEEEESSSLNGDCERVAENGTINEKPNADDEGNDQEEMEATELTDVDQEANNSISQMGDVPTEADEAEAEDPATGEDRTESKQCSGEEDTENQDATPVSNKAVTDEPPEGVTVTNKDDEPEDPEKDA